MRSLLPVILSIVCAGSFARADQAIPSVADSPETVRPLLVGATIPAVTLADADGRPVALKDRVARKPSILIFYRGGW